MVANTRRFRVVIRLGSGGSSRDRFADAVQPAVDDGRGDCVARQRGQLRKSPQRPATVRIPHRMRRSTFRRAGMWLWLVGLCPDVTFCLRQRARVAIRYGRLRPDDRACCCRRRPGAQGPSPQAAPRPRVGTPSPTSGTTPEPFRDGSGIGRLRAPPPTRHWLEIESRTSGEIELNDATVRTSISTRHRIPMARSALNSID
jgi:hypothetical protein